MFDLLPLISDAVERNAQYAALLFAIIAFAESTAFVGILIPATPVLFFVGTMLGTGKLDVIEVVPAAIMGATAGYGLSYVAGRALGRSFTRHRWLRPHRRGAARARLFFARYGALSILLGRYVLGPFQSVVPFVAGTLKMSSRRFWAFNIVSSVVWVILTLAPGFVVSRSMSHMPLGQEAQASAAALLTAISAGAVLLCLVLPLMRLVARRARVGAKLLSFAPHNRYWVRPSERGD